MRITLARVENYKNVRFAEIVPTADRALLFVSGPNASGKSSLLDAIQLLLEGKKAQAKDPVRHGEKSAEIYGETDNGYTIRRKITAGSSTLEVCEKSLPDHPLKSPQTVLDDLIGARFIDPLAFLREKPADQRAFLMELVDRNGEIAKLDASHEKVFVARTETGRKYEAAKGEFARLGADREVPPPVSVGALAQERERIVAVQTAKNNAAKDMEVAARAVGAAETAVGNDQRRITGLQNQIAELERQLAAAKESLGENIRSREVARTNHGRAQELHAVQVKAWDEVSPRLLQIDTEIGQADAKNKEHHTAQAFNERRAAAKKALDALGDQYDAQTRRLAQIDDEKKKKLAAAKLPVDGLGFDKEGITFRGVPLSQASQAERIRVAVGLAIAGAPKLDDIFIRDAALLDDNSLALVEEMAKAARKTVWLEVIQSDVDGAIVMQDGTAHIQSEAAS